VSAVIMGPELEGSLGNHARRTDPDQLRKTEIKRLYSYRYVQRSFGHDVVKSINQTRPILTRKRNLYTSPGPGTPSFFLLLPKVSAIASTIETPADTSDLRFVKG
jgi:hypothetical protein